MDSHCAEDSQSNLEANDTFLTEENVRDHNREDAGDAESTSKKHLSCLQELQGKLGKVSAKQTPPSAEDDDPKAEEADEMIEETEALGSPENLEAEPGHDACVNNHGNATEEELAPEIPRKGKEESCNGDHSRQ